LPATASACKRVTEPGQQVLKSIEIILREVANLQRIGDEFAKQDAGTLSIATTHTQARYFLPEPVAQLRQRFPKVQLVLHQGMPEQVARMLLDDVAEIGLATESLALHEGLVTLPCYEWQHVLVVPIGHPWRRGAADAGATGRTHPGAVPPHGDGPHAHRPGV
jgi:LysR family cys regulon transcriptional activator